MTVAGLMAVRIQKTLDEIAALKARPAREVRAERALQKRLAALLGPILGDIQAKVEAEGAPSDVVRRRTLLAALENLEGELVETIAPEALEAAEAGRRRIEAKVRTARKDLEGDLLLGVVADVGRRTLARLVGRVVDGLDADDPAVALGGLVGSVTGFEAGRLARTVLRASEEHAAVSTERELGVDYHQWVTAGDSQVRESHAELDGQITRVGARFSNGARMPGEAGCRCRIEPWFPPEGFVPPVGNDWFYA